jgi:hypothetical protein
MTRFKNKANVLGWLLGVLLFLAQRQSAFGFPITMTVTGVRGTNVYNIFLQVPQGVDTNGVPINPLAPETIASITEDGIEVPFQLFDLALVQLYVFSVSPPVDSFSGTLTLTWSNYVTNIVLGFAPVFLVEPQSQCLLVGSNVTFTAQAIHISGYQWQKDATNLIDNGHFIGVTNSTLTISNAQPEDAGDYVVMANQPGGSMPSVDAYLFKPIQMGLTILPMDGGYQLQVSNQDGSPVGAAQVSHFAIYTTTDLSLRVAGWDVVTPTGIPTNGFYQIVFPDDGSVARFWQVGQHP